MSLEKIDNSLIHFFRKISMPFARLSLFIIFFWFGVLKVIGLSFATPLVQRLFEQTISGIPFDTFIILFGLLECLIGLLFLFPKLVRIVMPILFIHMVTTSMPLFLLPGETWASFFVPTLEGQYIIKNLAIIAVAILMAANLEPFAKSSSNVV
jgi:uncharacterized membrane protein YkgB